MVCRFPATLEVTEIISPHSSKALPLFLSIYFGISVSFILNASLFYMKGKEIKIIRTKKNTIKSDFHLSCHQHKEALLHVTADMEELTHKKKGGYCSAGKTTELLQTLKGTESIL